MEADISASIFYFGWLFLMFCTKKYRILLFSMLFLLANGSNAADDNGLSSATSASKGASVTLSIGTETPGEVQYNNPLTLQEAERLALENDSLTKKIDAEAVSLKQKGVAAARLPDPKLRLGLMNMPTDTFEIQQEPMTQQVIGLQLMFPPYNMLDYKGEQLVLKGEAKTLNAVNQQRETLRSVRIAWLKVYLQHHAGEIVKKSEDLFKQLVQITKSKYRSGQSNQQAVIRAELELSLLQDRQIQIETMKDQALAELGKWVGAAQFNRPLSLDALTIPEISDRQALKQAVDKHPVIQASVANVNAAKKGIDVAKARYHPGWKMDLNYGRREESLAGVERADFISLVFMVDLPFFTSNRQDKWLEASEKEYNSAQYSVEERRKNLKRRLDAEYIKWTRLSERLQHFRGKVLPQASQNAQAALKAYSSQVTGFDPLMRARLMELKIKLQALNVLVSRAQAQVNLLYISGDG
jgi:outer membrane protein TolC